MAETIRLNDGRGLKDFPVRDGAVAGIYIGGRRTTRRLSQTNGLITESLAGRARCLG